LTASPAAATGAAAWRGSSPLLGFKPVKVGITRERVLAQWWKTGTV
jgi:hypothetical protein